MYSCSLAGDKREDSSGADRNSFFIHPLGYRRLQAITSTLTLRPLSSWLSRTEVGIFMADNRLSVVLGRAFVDVLSGSG